MADDAIYRLAHRDAYNASFAARKTQKVNSVAAQAATPTRFLALKDDCRRRQRAAQPEMKEAAN